MEFNQFFDARKQCGVIRWMVVFRGIGLVSKPGPSARHRARDRCTEWTPSAAPASLVAHLPHGRVAFGRLFDNVEIHHQFAHLLVQALDFAILVGLIIEGATTQGVLGTRKEALFPLGFVATRWAV
jgi:hypothetical protein